MAFDYKKEYKEFYMPKNKPSIVTVPCMNYIAVRGHGDPNQEDGEYKRAIGLLYGIAFTIKMSKKIARLCHKSGLRLGCRGSNQEKETGLLESRISDL
jgi:hypothetical protein